LRKGLQTLDAILKRARPNPIFFSGIRWNMGSQQFNGEDRPAAAAVSRLLDDLVAPLEIIINLLYLIRVSGADAELRDRFLALADSKLQEIVQVMKRHDPASGKIGQASELKECCKLHISK
jgi:hypothetical protein